MAGFDNDADADVAYSTSHLELISENTVRMYQPRTLALPLFKNFLQLLGSESPPFEPSF